MFKCVKGLGDRCLSGASCHVGRARSLLPIMTCSVLADLRDSRLARVLLHARHEHEHEAVATTQKQMLEHPPEARQQQAEAHG